MMLRVTCPRCGDFNISWQDRPEDKGVERSQTIACFVCLAGQVQVSGKGGPAA